MSLPARWQVTTALLLLFATGVRAADPVLPPLTTVENNPRLPGKFIWADLVTDDVPKALIDEVVHKQRAQVTRAIGPGGAF